MNKNPARKMSDEIRLFGMKNLLVESELVALEESGIDLGHRQYIKKQEIVDSELFDADIKQRASKMSELYVLYFSLENTVRRLISERLTEEVSPNWWNEPDIVPDAIKVEVQKKQEAEKDSPVSIRSEDPLFYTNFGELIVILESNWQHFSDTIRSKKAMRQILSQLNTLRNPIAHSCDLIDDEILRFKLLIRDWQRIQM